MRKLFLFIVLFLSALNMSAQNPKIIDEVIWIVGDEAIFKSDVEKEIMRARYEGHKIEGNAYCIIPEQIAVQKLFLHQAALDSISVNETNVNAQVDHQINYYIANIGSKEKVEEERKQRRWINIVMRRGRVHIYNALCRCCKATVL